MEANTFDRVMEKMRELRDLLEPMQSIQLVAENEFAPVLACTIAQSALCIVHCLNGQNLIDETVCGHDSYGARATEESSPEAAAPAPRSFKASREEGITCTLQKHNAATLGGTVRTSTQTRRSNVNSWRTSRISVERKLCTWDKMC